MRKNKQFSHPDTFSIESSYFIIDERSKVDDLKPITFVSYEPCAANIIVKDIFGKKIRISRDKVLELLIGK